MSSGEEYAVRIWGVRIREVVGYLYLTEKEHTYITTIYRVKPDQ